MTETPRTAAGRALVEDEPLLVTGEHSMLRRVLAIEAEAAQDAARQRDELRTALVNLEDSGRDIVPNADLGVPGDGDWRRFTEAMESARALLRATEGKQRP